MRLLRSKRLSGGVFFTATKVATIDVPIETLFTRDVLRVPLHARHNLSNSPDRSPETEMELLAGAGDRIEAGDPLAQPPSGAPAWARVFAPVSGIIGNRVTAGTARGAAAAVELMPSGDQADISPSRTGSAEPSPNGLIDQLAALGIGIDADRCATDTQSAAGRPEWIIVDGLESAPYATARTRTLIEHSGDLIDAARRLGGALGVSEVQFVVDRALGALVNTLRRHALGSRDDGGGQTRETTVTVVPIPNQHPQCHPRMLFRTVTGRELPPDRTPREAGAWIIGTCELLDIHRALVDGLPPVAQTLTVAGDAVQRLGNYRVPVGMSVEAILLRVGLCRDPARVVIGNALTGVAIRSADTIITPDVEGIYVASASAERDQTPGGCLRCGFCIDVCPVKIDPVGVFNAVELGHPSRVPSWVARACLHCGLCDYVCPARLPLMRAVRHCRAHAGGGQYA